MASKKRKLEKVDCPPSVLKLLSSNNEGITQDSLLNTATVIISSIEKRLDAVLGK